MKLVFIFGNAAVGKMTVGQELCKITDLKLFHNHMSIEPVLEIFDYFNAEALFGIRDVIFESFSKTDNYGLVFTYMFCFDSQSNWDYVEHVKSIFLENNPDSEFYYMELVAPFDVRMERNITKNRLEHKKSKRNIDESNQRVVIENYLYRCESEDGEIPFDNYIKIDNTNISAEDVAILVKNKFNL